MLLKQDKSKEAYNRVISRHTFLGIYKYSNHILGCGLGYIMSVWGASYVIFFFFYLACLEIYKKKKKGTYPYCFILELHENHQKKWGFQGRGEKEKVGLCPLF